MPKSPPVTRTVYSLTLATHLIILNFSRLLLKFHECLNFNTEQVKCPRYREVVASILQKAEFSCSILRSVAVTLITTPPHRGRVGALFGRSPARTVRTLGSRCFAHPSTAGPGPKCAVTLLQSGVLDRHILQLSVGAKPLFYHDDLDHQARGRRSKNHTAILLQTVLGSKSLGLQSW